MTTTSEYLNEFTPDWPHGHVLVHDNGDTVPFIVKVTDWPGKYSIWGHEVGQEGFWRFHADGTSGHAYYLANVAPPRPKPREWWAVSYIDGKHASGLFPTYEAAHHHIKAWPGTIIRVREVLDEEDTK